MLSIAVLSIVNTIFACLKCKRVKLRLIYSRLTLARDVNNFCEGVSL